MMETIVLAIAGGVNLLLGGTAFLLWQAIQSSKDAIRAEAAERQEADTRLQAEISKVEAQVSRNDHHMSETYVRRDQYREDISELKALIRQILSRLDAKADK